MRTINYGHQSIDKDDIKAVIEVLESDWLTQGPKIKEFEERLCDYTGAKYAVCVSSGTAALHAACLAAGIQKGDEVITSPITFAASGNCVLYCQGKPVFVDVELQTGNINPGKIKEKITRKTKAIIPVHFAGLPCDLEAIHKIARGNKLLIIEDAAHALGAIYRNSRIGAGKFSDMTIFSFHPVKAITTGEGGAVLTNRRDLYERLLLFRNHGITKEPGKLKEKRKGGLPWYYEMQELGFNYRITDFQAALGISQLGKIESFIKKRNDIAAYYNTLFSDNELLTIPAVYPHVRHAYHLYPLKIHFDKMKVDKAEFLKRLARSGIYCQVHYIPVYLHPYYRKNFKFRSGGFPTAELFYAREVSLPIFPALKESELEYTVDRVLRSMEQ